MATVRLQNGLRKLKMAQILDDGSYGEIFTVSDMTEISCETAEGEVNLPAGNRIIYSKKSKGKTTGTVGFYTIDEDTEAKIFGYKKNTNGDVLYGMVDIKPYFALISEFTIVNPDTGIESNGYLIFPKVAVGELQDSIQTKNENGDESFNAKSLSYTAMSLDNTNKTYKLKGYGETPETITADMFEAGVGATLPMYYGRLSVTEVGGSIVSAYSDITETQIKGGANVTTAPAKTMGKTSLGLTSDTQAGDHLIVAVPAKGNYTVTKDNGLGGKVVFDSDAPGSDIGVDITIDGEAYKLYGEVLSAPAEIFFYVD